MLRNAPVNERPNPILKGKLLTNMSSRLALAIFAKTSNAWGETISAPVETIALGILKNWRKKNDYLIIVNFVNGHNISYDTFPTRLRYIQHRKGHHLFILWDIQFNDFLKIIDELFWRWLHVKLTVMEAKVFDIVSAYSRVGFPSQNRESGTTEFVSYWNRYFMSCRFLMPWNPFGYEPIFET